MSFVKKLRLRWIRWQQSILYYFVKTQIIGTQPEQLDIDHEEPVVYAMWAPSHSEKLVIDHEVQRLNLHSPYQQGLSEQSPKRTFFHLYKRTGIFRKKGSPSVSRDLLALTEWMTENPDKNIQIIPVRVFWGRAPDKEGSFLRIWLQNSGALGGRIVTFMAILFNGRNTFVHFSPALNVKDLYEPEQTHEVLARKIARMLRVHNRQVSTSVLGPDLSHRQTLVHTLPNRPLVTKAIQDEIERKGISREKGRKLALKYADEIASNISYTNIRFLDIVLTWVWNRLYDGINLHNIDPIKEIGKHHEIIYVPCHRSHIDYLLLSYVLYHQGLQLPQIAAGINLNFPVVGPILRRGGAFFMRRTFRDNPLYAAVFDEYLHSVFSNGYAAEYFVEGGRSRTGRTLNPKAGMLAMTLRSYLRDSRKPIVFMPVYIGYEKVFEASSYLGELRGQKKKKESLLGVLGTLKSFKNYFGKVHVTFGDAINLSDFLDQQQPAWLDQNYDEQDYRPEWAPQVVNNLASEVVKQINRATSVNPVSLLALSILSTPKQALGARGLMLRMEFYRNLLQEQPYSHLTQLPAGDASNWLEHCERLGIISRYAHPMGDLIQADDRQAVTMTYYRNNVLHLFALPSLIACLFVNNQRYAQEDALTAIKALYPFLKDELFLHWENESLDQAVEHWLNILHQHGCIFKNDQGYHSAPAISEEYSLLNSLANNIMLTLERYFLTVSLLVKQGSGYLTAETLEEQSTLLAQRIGMIYGMNAPEFFDKTLFRTLIKGLHTQGMIEVDDEGTLNITEPLSSLESILNQVLDGELKQSVLLSINIHVNR